MIKGKKLLDIIEIEYTQALDEICDHYVWHHKEDKGKECPKFDENFYKKYEVKYDSIFNYNYDDISFLKLTQYKDYYIIGYISVDDNEIIIDGEYYDYGDFIDIIDGKYTIVTYTTIEDASKDLITGDKDFIKQRLEESVCEKPTYKILAVKKIKQINRVLKENTQPDETQISPIRLLLDDIITVDKSLGGIIIDILENFLNVIKNIIKLLVTSIYKLWSFSIKYKKISIISIISALIAIFVWYGIVPSDIGLGNKDDIINMVTPEQPIDTLQSIDTLVIE